MLLRAITEIEDLVQKWKFITVVVFTKVFQKTVHCNSVMSLVVIYACIKFMGKLATSFCTISWKGVFLPVSYSNGILGQHPGLRRNSSLQDLARSSRLAHSSQTVSLLSTVWKTQATSLWHNGALLIFQTVAPSSQ